MKNWSLLVSLGSWAFGGWGCIKPDMEPIERSMNTITKEVLKPAVDKMAGELSGRTAQLQGQGSVINPGYRISGHAGIFHGAIFDFNLNATGISANLAGAAQADAKQSRTGTPSAAGKPETESGRP